MTINWPTTPTLNQEITGPRGEIWKWDGQKWVSVATGGDGGGGVATGPYPPVNPQVGDLWFDPVEGQLYIWFQDQNSAQWVVTINQGGGGGDGGNGGGSTYPIGVTNGSNPAPGEIGEVISIDSTANFPARLGQFNVFLNIPPGDWDIRFAVYYYANATSAFVADFMYPWGWTLKTSWGPSPANTAGLNVGTVGVVHPQRVSISAASSFTVTYTDQSATTACWIERTHMSALRLR